MNKLQQIFQEYQNFTVSTAIYPDAGRGTMEEVLYLSLGLLGELKEWFESGYDVKEAGDVLWYCSQLCNVFTLSLDMVYDNSEGLLLALKEPNLAEALKKYIRDGKYPFHIIYEYMKYAIGHIKYRYHYSENNPPLEETMLKILELNMKKLKERQATGTLQGSGETVEERSYKQIKGSIE